MDFEGIKFLFLMQSSKNYSQITCTELCHLPKRKSLMPKISMVKVLLHVHVIKYSNYQQEIMLWQYSIFYAKQVVFQGITEFSINVNLRTYLQITELCHSPK